jgi:hypothetical protein
MSYAISVGAGEAGLGQWEVERDDSGILVEELLMGLRDKLGHVERGVSGIEVWVGLMTGVNVVIDDLIAVICLEACSDDCPSWHWRFLSGVEPLTEREGAKGAEKKEVSMLDVVASNINMSSLEW